MPDVTILGIRGIPARHGGFETFAEELATYLVERGWKVTVYCQGSGGGPVYEDCWNGATLVHIPVSRTDALGSVLFDWRAVNRAAKRPGLILTLGYNTAVFSFLLRLRRRRNLINMDGIEWRRAKWSPPVRAWFYANERLGCWLGDHLIADHPEIMRHLSSRVATTKITVIPYGSEAVDRASTAVLEKLGLAPYGYATIIARPEPENSILEIVSAFSDRPRGYTLVVLGSYNPEANAYHAKVMHAAGAEVRFLGAVYDKEILRSLRYFSRIYLHGHQVGGTNPSLVEALGAGCPVLAHDNPFNRWVAGESAHFFAGREQCAKELEVLLDNQQELVRMRQGSRKRHADEFTWERVLGAYESLLLQWQSPGAHGQRIQ